MRPLSPWSRQAPAPSPASHAIPASAPAHPRSVSPKPTSIGSQPPTGLHALPTCSSGGGPRPLGFDVPRRMDLPHCSIVLGSWQDQFSNRQFIVAAEGRKRSSIFFDQKPTTYDVNNKC